MPFTPTMVREKLNKFFGFSSFKGDQEKIIMNLLAGNDTFVIMPTGGGKSLCYQLPALLLPGTAIVVSPLIALMKNQVDAIRGFVSGNGSIAHFLNSSLNKAQLAEVRDDLASGKTKLLYVAPESLTKEDNISILRDIHISFYAVDEAHCISDWGHDFRPEYRRIRPIADEIGKAPIIALTATATPKVQNDIIKNLGIRDACVFKSSFDRPNLYYEIRDKIDQDKDIIRFIKQNPGKSGIIYCLSRKKVEELNNILSINGIRSVPYHAGMDAKMRAENQDKFLMEDVDVIVATIAFGMGIDKPDVRFVIHYDLPRSLEGYYQETGRAGRDGKDAICITYYSYKDIRKLEKFLQGKPLSEQEIGRQLLDEAVNYAESGECRHKLLLAYFGEDYKGENCGCCDNCRNPRPKSDISADLTALLSLADTIGGKFKATHLASILSGILTSNIKLYGHEKLAMFGKGKDHSPKYWDMIAHHATISHLLDKDIENYGLLGITEAGKRFLASPYPVFVATPRTFSEATEEDPDDEPSAPRSSSGGDMALLAMLKELRKDEAHRLHLQPWIIFSDSSLEDMSILYPENVDELKTCQGVGEGKAKKYGRPFMDLIRKYVEENDIERPVDFVVKSMPNKSSDKIALIQSIDRRMDLADIADNRNMDINELIQSIEEIVEFGTRLNLDYYIENNIDPDEVEDIYNYFKEDAESDSLEDAFREFGNDYDETDIRLVRLKFLSEVAN
mgnify:CR=1 FL=1